MCFMERGARTLCARAEVARDREYQRRLRVAIAECADAGTEMDEEAERDLFDSAFDVAWDQCPDRRERDRAIARRFGC